jgi:hypothetical protein
MDSQTTAPYIERSEGTFAASIAQAAGAVRSPSFGKEAELERFGSAVSDTVIAHKKMSPFEIKGAQSSSSDGEVRSPSSSDLSSSSIPTSERRGWWIARKIKGFMGPRHSPSAFDFQSSSNFDSRMTCTDGGIDMF